MAGIMMLLMSMMARWMDSIGMSSGFIDGPVLEAALQACSRVSGALQLLLLPCKWALAVVNTTVCKLHKGFLFTIKMHRSCWWCAGVAAQAAWPLLRFGGCMPVYGMFVMLRCLSGSPPSLDEASAMLDMLVPTGNIFFDKQGKAPASIKVAHRSCDTVGRPITRHSSTNTTISSTTSAPSTPTGTRGSLQSLFSASASAASSRRTSGSISSNSSGGFYLADNNGKPADLCIAVDDSVCLVGRAALAVAVGFTSKGHYVAPYSPGAAAVAKTAKETACAAVWRVVLNQVFVL